MSSKQNFMQKVVQIKQWLDKQRTKADGNIVCLIIIVFLDIKDIITVLVMLARVVKWALQLVLFFLPYLISVLECIITLASTFSYKKKEFFYGI